MPVGMRREKFVTGSEWVDEVIYSSCCHASGRTKERTTRAQRLCARESTLGKRTRSLNTRTKPVVSTLNKAIVDWRQVK
jgi:hypothetical protein